MFRQETLVGRLAVMANDGSGSGYAKAPIVIQRVVKGVDCLDRAASSK